MDPLIEKQFKKWGLSAQHLPTDLEEWQRFLKLIERLFEEKERNEYLLERALAISTDELNLLQSVNCNPRSALEGKVQHAPWRVAGESEAPSRQELDALNRNLQQQTALANRLAKEAESAMLAKSRFLANMSHEFRSPMNSVMGMASLLKGTELTAEQCDYVESILSGGGKLLDLINDIIDYSKIESGAIRLDPEEFDPLDHLGEVCGLFVPLAQEKLLRLDYRVDSEVPARLKGDVLRIRQVWINLISNALKFTEKGFIRVELRAEAAGKHFVRLITTVRDSGVGIDASRVEELFDAFMQADDSETRQFGGSGLGLAISKRLCQLMGGDLVLSRNDTDGTEFEVDCLVAAVPDVGSVLALHSVRSSLKDCIRVVGVDPSDFTLCNLGQILRLWEVPHELYPDLSSMVQSRANHRAELIVIHIEALQDLRTSVPDVLQTLCHNAAHVVIHGGRPAVLEEMESIEGVHVLAEALDPRQLNRLIRSLSPLPAANGTVIRERDVMRYSETSLNLSFSERYPLRILLVEDSPMNQKVTRFMMEKLGYQLDVVGNGAEAIQSVKQSRPDLILMDLQMPVMGGVECCRLLRDENSAHPSLYICALTANVSVEDQLNCRNAQMDDFLPKPLSLSALKRVLKRAHLHCVANQPLLGPVSESGF